MASEQFSSKINDKCLRALKYPRSALRIIVRDGV